MLRNMTPSKKWKVDFIHWFENQWHISDMLRKLKKSKICQEPPVIDWRNVVAVSFIRRFLIMLRNFPDEQFWSAFSHQFETGGKFLTFYRFRKNRIFFQKKAIIFSLDAIFAIITGGVMILACFFYLSQTTTNIYQNQDIYKISLDSLTILEKDDTFKTAVEISNITTIQLFLNSLSAQFCGNITLYTSSSANVLSAQKTGCTAKNESTIAVRNFIVNNSIYYAKMEAWYK